MSWKKFTNSGLDAKVYRDKAFSLLANDICRKPKCVSPES